MIMNSNTVGCNNQQMCTNINDVLNSILCSFNPKKADESVQQLKLLHIKDPVTFNYFTRLVLHKLEAEEEHLAFEYGKLCLAFIGSEVFSGVISENVVTEFNMLLNFYQGIKTSQKIVETQLADLALPEPDRDVTVDDKIRTRMKKLCCFAGELYKGKILQGKIICRAVELLLAMNDDFAVDCLCTLFSTCGKELEDRLRNAGSELMDLYINSMKMLTVYSQRFGISESVTNKAQRLYAYREMTWPHKNVKSTSSKNNMAKKKSRKSRKRRKPKDYIMNVLPNDEDSYEEFEEYEDSITKVFLESPDYAEKSHLSKSVMGHLVTQIIEDLLINREFKRVEKRLESEDWSTERKNSFMSKAVQYVLDKSWHHRVVAGELIADLIKPKFLHIDQLLHQLMNLFNESAQLVIDVPNFWANVCDIMSASLREELFTITDLRILIENIGFKKTTESAKFICHLLTALKNREGEQWVQLVAWDNTVLTLGDFIMPTEIRHYINHFDLNYLVIRPSIVDPTTKELSVDSVSKIITGYLELDEEKAFTRIYRWSKMLPSIYVSSQDTTPLSSNHVADKIKSREFITALTLGVCGFCIDSNNKLDVERLKTHCKILSSYMKDNKVHHQLCLDSVGRLVDKYPNAKDLKDDIASVLNEMNVISDSVYLGECITYTNDSTDWVECIAHDTSNIRLTDEDPAAVSTSE